MAATAQAPAPSPAIDSLVPAPLAQERHERLIAAPPGEVYAALKGLTPGGVPLFVPLMALRLLPALLTGRTAPPRTSAPLLDLFVDEGFALLEDRPGEELVLAAIGRFWRLARNTELAAVADAAEFRRFAEPGWAKAAMDFRLVPEGGGTRLVTETRVACADARAERLFRLYWLAIRPGSGLIRHGILAAVARRCEQDR